MKQTVRLGRVAGIPVGLHWSVLVIAVIIAVVLGTTVLPEAVSHAPTGVYWAVAIPSALLFLASLLAHELAHAVVARRHGVRVRAITLWMLGGVAELDGESPSPRADLVIAVVGPIASLAAAMFFGIVAIGAWALGVPAVVTAVLAWLAFMNAVLAVFNLLPGAPLDGGRVLRAILWKKFGDRARADLAAARAGRVLGAGLMAGGVLQVAVGRSGSGLWLALIGWFLIGQANIEAMSRTARQAVQGVRARAVMTENPDCAPGWNPIEEFVERVLMNSPQSVFPVVDLTGTPVGVVTTEMMVRVPPGERVFTRLSEMQLPLSAEHLSAPDDLITDLLNRRPLAGELVSVVTEDGRVTGMVTVQDLTRAVQRGRLRSGRAPTRQDREDR
ncbi:MAG: site-2 protease family protein [Streptosporangiaceae bacterium]|nr:site-2 protease family protein [Streptosporangiaceae bacterium]